jgi:hypothetical protein
MTKKDKRTQIDLQNTTHIIKERTTRTPLKTKLNVDAGISVLQMTTCMFRLSKSQSGYFLINNLSPGGVTCAARIAYPSGASTFSFVFSGVRVVRSFIICVVFCRSICVLLSFLVIALSVLLPFTASVYPFGIFKLFWNLPSQSKRSG